MEHSDADDDLAAASAERDDERRYHEALRQLERALERFPADLPFPPPAPDEHQVAALNTLWKTDRESASAGVGGRLRTIVLRLAAPLFRRQEAFNAVVVDHLNRQLGFAHDTRRSIAATRDVVAELVALQRHVLDFLRQLSPYDNRQRDALRAVQGALNAVADELLKRSDAALARERRHEMRTAELDASVAALRQRMIDIEKALQR